MYDLVVAGGGPAGAAAAIIAAKRGLSVVLIEKGGHNRQKPCGGLIPRVAVEAIEEVFGEGIPEAVFSAPRELGLFYSPPSGPRNGGRMRNYRLLNLQRAPFDEWLRGRAEAAGAEVIYDSALASFAAGDSVKCIINRGDVVSSLTSSYLIGADGVFSTVRRGLYGVRADVMRVVQETWEAPGGVDDLFYVFLDGRLTRTYGYMIPKGECVEIGLGVEGDASEKMGMLRTLLSERLGVKLGKLVQRAGWAIPYGSIYKGAGNVLLAGDAAGFCNPLSGEGIRLSIESGEAAGTAVADAAGGGDAVALYSRYVEQIDGLVRRVHEYSKDFTDEDREEFVRAELQRVNLG